MAHTIPIRWRTAFRRHGRQHSAQALVDRSSPVLLTEPGLLANTS